MQHNAPCGTTSAQLQLGTPSTQLMSALQKIQHLASQDAVVVFSKSSCCMCISAKTLLSKLGVYPVMYELDKEDDGKEMEKALLNILPNPPSVPAIFVGGKLVGGMEQLITSHIKGFLVPLLKEEGALWL